MRRFFIIMSILLFFSTSVLAEENDLSTDLRGDLDSQKIISPQQYEEVIKNMKSRIKKKKSKEKELMPSVIRDDETEDEDIPGETDSIMEQYTATLMVPTALLHENGVIPVGYYKVCATRDSENNYYLNFYQGIDKIASIRAFLTQNTYEQDSINYVQILPHSEKVLRIIYGSIEYNLETLVRTL